MTGLMQLLSGNRENITMDSTDGRAKSDSARIDREVTVREITKFVTMMAPSLPITLIERSLVLCILADFPTFTTTAVYKVMMKPNCRRVNIIWNIEKPTDIELPIGIHAELMICLPDRKIDSNGKEMPRHHEISSMIIV